MIALTFVVQHTVRTGRTGRTKRPPLIVLARTEQVPAPPTDDDFAGFGTCVTRATLPTGGMVLSFARPHPTNPAVTELTTCTWQPATPEDHPSC